MAKKKGFSIGDKVQLLAGGPVMAVEDVHVPYGEDRQVITCQWFAGAKLQSGRFDPDTLIPVKDEETT